MGSSIFGQSAGQYDLPKTCRMLRRMFKLEFKPADLKKPTVVILILSNLVPLYGVLFLDWEVFPILLLFWTENIIIGVFNIFKMAICSPASPGQWAAKLFLVPFFSVHYGIFTLVHGLFIYTLFGGLIIKETEIPDLTLLRQITGGYSFTLGFLSLFLSHGISFVINYIHKGKYKQANLNNLMWQPYGRVVILHLTIIFGGMLVSALGSPTGGLILLVVLKMAIDALSHLKLHAGNSPNVPKSGLATG
ncbi:MAG: hypothetical protein HW384_308 [Dehalococcoidia bacterium]|nr:hypothetical protein [Dehalococcoidia bacterium]MBF8303924.1 hypothetical protein [Dehalococcoidia bacterium]